MPVAFWSRQGYFVEFQPPKKSPPWTHRFCGAHKIPGAICASCQRPLLRLLSLDTRDRRLPFDSTVEQIHLLFCWTCGGEPLTYRLLDNGEVQVIGRPKGAGSRDPDFPYSNYPTHFPGKKVALRAISSKAQNLIRRANLREVDEISESRQHPGVLTPRHQVGGEPYLVQGTRRDIHERCGLCSQEMPILACIGDDSGTKKGFVGNRFVQVIYHYCVACRFVTAYNECD